GVAHEPELDEDVLALAGGQDLARRGPSIDLLEAILQPQSPDAKVAGKLLEVDDEVDALGHTGLDAAPGRRGHPDRLRQEVAVVGDDPEGGRLARVVGIGEEQLVEARRPAVQDPEAIAALLHLEERLQDAVDQELVANQAVETEQVEADLPGPGVDQLVGQEERDIELREAREPEAGVLVARVEIVEDEVEAREALVDVLCRVV